MKNLIKESFEFASGDATDHYKCELLRENTKVRDFIEAARRSSAGENHVFDEKFVRVVLIVDNDGTDVEIVFFNMECGKTNGIEMIEHVTTPRGSSEKTELEILKKFGDCTVKKCSWSGGWASGRYALRIDYPVDLLKKELN